MELDDLKGLWEDQDRKLSETVRLNTRFLRSSVLDRAEAALRPLARQLWFELTLNVLAALGTGSLLARHVAEARFLIPAVMLHLGVIGLLVAGVRQLVAIRTIDYDTPVVVIQKRLESLRVERVRATTLTLLLAPLLWTPLLIVALEGLFGVDAYATLGAAFLGVNLLFGLVVLLLAVWASRRYADRLDRSPVFQRLMRTIAGHSLASASAVLSSIVEFEEDERQL